MTTENPPDAIASFRPPRRSSGTGRLSIRLTPQTRAVLERAAAAEGTTVAALCGQAVVLHARHLGALHPPVDPLAGVTADAVVWALTQLAALADVGAARFNRHKRDEMLAAVRQRLATLAPEVTP